MNNPAFLPGQQPGKILPPLAATHQHCLWCCNGSALELRLCPAKSCPLWEYRHGRKPTAAMLAEQGGYMMYPLEDGLSAVEFYKNGGTALKAIKRYCLDCSGGSKSELRNCKWVTCPLHPFRFGTNPNRKMSPAKRKIRAGLLRANVERSRRDRK